MEMFKQPVIKTEKELLSIFLNPSKIPYLWSDIIKGKCFNLQQYANLIFLMQQYRMATADEPLDFGKIGDDFNDVFAVFVLNIAIEHLSIALKEKNFQSQKTVLKELGKKLKVDKEKVSNSLKRLKDIDIEIYNIIPSDLGILSNAVCFLLTGGITEEGKKILNMLSKKIQEDSNMVKEFIETKYSKTQEEFDVNLCSVNQIKNRIDEYNCHKKKTYKISTDMLFLSDEISSTQEDLEQIKELAKEISSEIESIEKSLQEDEKSIKELKKDIEKRKKDLRSLESDLLNKIKILIVKEQKEKIAKLKSALNVRETMLLQLTKDKTLKESVLQQLYRKRSYFLKKADNTDGKVRDLKKNKKDKQSELDNLIKRMKKIEQELSVVSPEEFFSPVDYILKNSYYTDIKQISCRPYCTPNIAQKQKELSEAFSRFSVYFFVLSLNQNT